MKERAFGKGNVRVLNRKGIERFLADVRKVKEGDLVTGNLLLVVSIANSYGNVMPVEDIIQEGNIGLIYAARHYDESIGEFSTYATRCIRRFIIEAIERDSRLVRRPHHAQDGFCCNDSLDAPLDDGEGNTITKADLMAGDADTNEDIDTLSVVVAHHLDKLSAREKEVVKLFYGIGTNVPMGYEGIGTMLSISAERARQIHVAALGKMRG